ATLAQFDDPAGAEGGFAQRVAGEGKFVAYLIDGVHGAVRGCRCPAGTARRRLDRAASRRDNPKLSDPFAVRNRNPNTVGVALSHLACAPEAQGAPGRRIRLQSAVGRITVSFDDLCGWVRGGFTDDCTRRPGGESLPLDSWAASVWRR